MNLKKTSFAAMITLVTLPIIVIIVISLSMIFFLNLRSVTHKETESEVSGRIVHLRDNISAVLEKQAELLHNTAFGISALLSSSVTQNDMAAYLLRIKSRFPEIDMLYYTNNMVWNQGGYSAFSDLDFVPPQTWNNTQRPWFLDAKKAGGKAAYSDPYLDAFTGGIVISVSTIVYDENKRDNGVVAADVQVTDLAVLLKSNLFVPEQHLYLLNSEGLFITYHDVEAVMVKNFFTETGFTHYQDKVLSSDLFSIMDSDVFFYSAKIPVSNWFIVSTIPKSVIFAEIDRFLLRLIFISIAFLAAATMVIVLLTRRLVKPLGYVTSVLREISGKWDLTRQIDERKAGNISEIAEIAGVFNVTFMKMKELIALMKNESLSLLDTGDELATHMSRTKNDIEGINKGIQGMRGQVLSQADRVNGAANSMERIITGLGKLNDHITVQAESVAQSSSAIEEMLANVQSVTQTLVKNTANINSLAESSEAGRVDLQKVASDIQEIARESEGLLEINSVMQNIASQTNLLSMNAAIEAAHAGESGKGFAVVADEIRKLAENSSVQSKTISAVLKKIKTSIDAITRSTGVVLERFGTIEMEVKTVSNQETQIRNAMEEQGVGSRQILEAVTQLNTITSQVRKASSDMITESREAQSQSGDLKRITSEVAGSMDEMTQGTDEISSAITRVQEISQENKENINTLSSEISRFKVE
ncbi:MAG: methyl-accepting chemotaxis protein [Treponema sp.]|nr:methyl-accepting chemotaxis protein [Treponema sp.]